MFKLGYWNFHHQFGAKQLWVYTKRFYTEAPFKSLTEMLDQIHRGFRVSPPNQTRLVLILLTRTVASLSIDWKSTCPSSKDPFGCSKLHQIFFAIAKQRSTTTLATIMLWHPVAPLLWPIGFAAVLPVLPRDLNHDFNRGEKPIR